MTTPRSVSVTSFSCGHLKWPASPVVILTLTEKKYRCGTLCNETTWKKVFYVNFVKIPDFVIFLLGVNNMCSLPLYHDTIRK